METLSFNYTFIDVQKNKQYGCLAIESFTLASTVALIIVQTKTNRVDFWLKYLAIVLIVKAGMGNPVRIPKISSLLCGLFVGDVCGLLAFGPSSIHGGNLLVLGGSCN